MALSQRRDRAAGLLLLTFGRYPDVHGLRLQPPGTPRRNGSAGFPGGSARHGVRITRSTGERTRPVPPVDGRVVIGAYNSSKGAAYLKTPPSAGSQACRRRHWKWSCHAEFGAITPMRRAATNPKRE